MASSAQLNPPIRHKHLWMVFTRCFHDPRCTSYSSPNRTLAAGLGRGPHHPIPFARSSRLRARPAARGAGAATADLATREARGRASSDGPHPTEPGTAVTGTRNPCAVVKRRMMGGGGDDVGAVAHLLTSSFFGEI